MDPSKIDRIFRERTESYEVTPSTDAWLQVASQLEHKNKGLMLWRVAAAVLLLVTAGLYTWHVSNSKTDVMLTAEVNHPQLEGELVWSLPALTNKQPTTANKVIAIKKLNTPDKELSENLIAEAGSTTQQPVIELQSKTALVQEIFIDEIILDQLYGVENTPTVKIRYYANITDQPEGKDKNTLGKLLAFAQQIKPGELLAGAREAKDDLFNSSVKLN
ncbi:MAG: hypothetical protein KI790_15635 [Cyclobacteriaceae bacterium]|nr:hypothetical protein [Cyclobacteriaceae bacterium HetDA_MAG_MS6]